MAKDIKTVLTQSQSGTVPRMPVQYVIPVDANGDIINGGSGSEGGAFEGLTNDQLRAAAIAVSGPLTNAQQIAIMGAANIAAWDGSSASATTNAILKALYAQNEQIITLLTTIATNTTTP